MSKRLDTAIFGQNKRIKKLLKQALSDLDMKVSHEDLEHASLGFIELFTEETPLNDEQTLAFIKSTLSDSKPQYDMDDSDFDKAKKAVQFIKKVAQPKRPRWHFAAAVGVLLLIIIGGFTFLQQQQVIIPSSDVKFTIQQIHDYRELAKQVAANEGKHINTVHQEIKKSFGLGEISAYPRDKYDDIMEQLTERATAVVPEIAPEFPAP